MTVQADLFSNCQHLAPNGVGINVRTQGRHVTGTITLARRNPKGRINCRVDFRTKASWPVGLADAAARLAARWFRDIGGFRKVDQSMVCHLPRHLAGGTYTEEELHDAIHAYAQRKWNRKNKAWKSLPKFLMDTSLIEACYTESSHYQARLDTKAQAAAKRIIDLENEQREDRRKTALEELDRQRGAFENLPEGIRQGAIERALNQHRQWFKGPFDPDIYHCRARVYAFAFELAKS